MQDKTIKAAEEEARRFLACAKAYREERLMREGWNPPRESGALRRASMDLTRALANMRRVD